MVYVFTGPPGSGKSTQSNLLAKALDMHQFSTSAMLREIAQENPELDALMREGNLAPYKYIVPALQRVKDHDHDRVILDGFPRTPEQVDAMIETWPSDHIVALRLIVPQQEVYKRIGRRALGGERYDDDPKILAHRLDVYNENERKMLDRLTSYGVRVLTINGDQSPQAIHQEILAQVKAL